MRTIQVFQLLVFFIICLLTTPSQSKSSYTENVAEMVKYKAEQGEPFYDKNIPLWLRLFEYVTPKQAQFIHRYHLHEILEGFDSGAYTSLIPYVGKYTEHHSILLSRTTSGEKENLKSTLIETLEAREHISRSGTDYVESPSNLLTVEDTVILSNIMNLMSFFDSKENWETIHSLFTEEEKFERGGVFLLEENSIVFQRLKGVIESEDSYRIPVVLGYISSIGNLHTHPLGNENPKEISGPSGYVYDYGKYDSSDTGSLRYLNKANRYLIDVVVTQMTQDTTNWQYNVDLYFRDILTNSGGKIRNKKHVTVLDIGIFTPEGVRYSSLVTTSKSFPNVPLYTEVSAWHDYIVDIIKILNVDLPVAHIVIKECSTGMSVIQNSSEITITVDPRIGMTTRSSVEIAAMLVHEFGHVVLNHKNPMTPEEKLLQEIEADRYAVNVFREAKGALQNILRKNRSHAKNDTQREVYDERIRHL